MGRRVTVDHKPLWTAKDCRHYLNKGIMGMVDYHLHKDNSWVGIEFTSMVERNEAIEQLKSEGYDTITYFKPLLHKLEHPTLTAEQHLNNLLSFYEENEVK